MDDSLRQQIAELAVEAEKFRSSPPSTGVSPPWVCPYIFPAGRADCLIMTSKKDRVALVTPCANKVLDDFNTKHSTDYVLDDCLDVCFSTLNPTLYFHCNFSAKPKSLPLVAGDYSPKFFFAKIQEGVNREKVPVDYSILHGVNTKLGCEMCPDVIAHPTSGPHEKLLFCYWSPHFFRPNEI